jgi:hypothetical protein
MGRAKKTKPTKSYIVPLFWAAFAVVITLLFLFNLPRIKENIARTHLGDRIQGIPVLGGGDETVESRGEGGEERLPSGETAAPELREEDFPSLEEALRHLNNQIERSPPPKPAEQAGGNERTMYFIRMDTDGTLVRTTVTRTVRAASSPLFDAVVSLLSGPTAAEEARGISSLIPAGTQLINAAMRGTTAVLNFNETFLFNNYGAEGYLAQLRQIVWTATEFPGVRNVQFLIEGQRVDFLGDNIRIDAPVSRDNL